MHPDDTERDNDEFDAGIDPRLAALYRDSARETAPGRLDRAVLREAAAALKPARFTSWSSLTMRPLAVATMLALSFAIVLQLSDPQWDSVPESVDLFDAEQDSAATRSDIAPAIAVDPEKLRKHSESPAAAAKQSSIDYEAVQDTINAPLNAPISKEEDAMERNCTVEQTASVELWWSCIGELERAGKVTEAQNERDLLLEKYPDSLPVE